VRNGRSLNLGFDYIDFFSRAGGPFEFANRTTIYFHQLSPAIYPLSQLAAVLPVLQVSELFTRKHLASSLHRQPPFTWSSTTGATQILTNVHGVHLIRRVVVIGYDSVTVSIAQLMPSVCIKVRGILLRPSNELQLGPVPTQVIIEAFSQFAKYLLGMGLDLAD
jgi:hypothetical protein